MRIKIGGFLEKWSCLTPVPTFLSWSWFVRQFFSRFATLTSSSFAALWATSLHSTSFERSDSYLLGFSLKIGMTALLRYFISAQKCDIYLNLHGHRANQTPLAFIRILERPWSLTQFFDLNQQIYLVLTCFEKKLSHSSSPMLKITNPNYLQISLHHPEFTYLVFYLRFCSIILTSATAE